MKKNKLIYFSMALAVLFTVSGCTTPKDTGMNNNLDRYSTQTRIGNRNNNDNMWDTGLDDGMDNMGNMMEMNNMGTNWNNTTNLNNGMVRNNRMTTSLGNLNTNANDLAKKISALPEVNSASVVVTDNTCLVGVDLNNNNNNNNNNNTNNAINDDLRNRIEKIVRDNGNINAADIRITSDPNLLTRIKNISTNIGNGAANTIETIGDDIEDIIRSIVNPGRVNTVR